MLCSLTMPAEYDVIAAHSPPVFSHSPPRYFSRASNNHNNHLNHNHNNHLNHNHNRHAVPQRSTSLPLMGRHGFALGMAVAAAAARRPPFRPILVSTTSSADLEVSDAEINSEPTSPTKLKKKVVFADDKGLQLEHVRMMTEPSCAPPRWTMQFLAQVTGGMAAAAVVNASANASAKQPETATASWEMQFAQPASDYVAFRSRLDNNNVSLENVIVREAEQLLLGTVKVRNLAFHKEVLIRSSSDEWATHEDAYCTFVNNACPASVTVLYDTFSFRIPLPPKSHRLEFCVCFRAENREFWDNNNGNNYSLVKKVTVTSNGEVDAVTAKIAELDLRSGVQTSSPMLIPLNSVKSKYDDALHAKMESWSEFASWNHLNNDTPYW